MGVRTESSTRCKSLLYNEVTSRTSIMEAAHTTQHTTLLDQPGTGYRTLLYEHTSTRFSIQETRNSRYPFVLHKYVQVLRESYNCCRRQYRSFSTRHIGAFSLLGRYAQKRFFIHKKTSLRRKRQSSITRVKSRPSRTGRFEIPDPIPE